MNNGQIITYFLSIFLGRKIKNVLKNSNPYRQGDKVKKIASALFEIISKGEPFKIQTRVTEGQLLIQFKT